MDMNDPAAVEAALDRVRRGDKDAYRTVVRAYQLVVRTYLGTHVYYLDDVDDLAQEVFLAAYRTLPTMPAGVPFAAWLKGIARHKLQAYRRDAARRVKALEQFRVTAARVSEEELDRAVDLERPEIIERLLECINKLPDRLRKVVRAGLDGGKPSALAGELGTTVGAVYTLHYRANQMLRVCVQRNPS
jgi:RNA polymerase sigma-70 factor (ECF subfamily)